MDSNLVTPNYNNQQIPKTIENEFNSNSNAPTPAQNPQDCPPPGFNNQNFQPQAYPYYPNQPYPYPNQPQPYPYNPNQPYPYNPNQPQPYNYQPNPYPQNQYFSCSPKFMKLAFLITSIIQFLFVIVEIIVLIVKGGMGITLIHIDEGAILVISILFFLSYLDKCEINNSLRSVLTGVVWFVGFGMRGMANMFIENFNNISTLFIFLIVRTFILFFSIPIASLKSLHFNNVS